MPEYLDENDEAVAGILATYDELVDRTERYREILRPQLDDANSTGDPKYIGRVTRSLWAADSLLESLDGSPLDALMDLRHFQHHIRVAKVGKMV